MRTDPIMADILAAFGRAKGGDRAEARGALEAIWARIGPDPAPMHAVALAHYLADLQDDPADELAWDMRALEAALACIDDDAAEASQLSSIEAFMPSLHANLGEDYVKLGDNVRAGEHLALARRFSDRLADDAYGRMIRRGIARLARTLGAEEP
jgi:hypothetical protein